MNRITKSALLALALVLAAFAGPAAAQPPLPVCGDCDGDFDVDVVDARVGWLTGAPVGLCDTDLDNDVDLPDAMSIARFGAGSGAILFCPAGIPSTSRLEPFNPASGNCFNGVAIGTPFRYRLFSSAFLPDSAFVSSPGLARGASAFTMAAAFAGLAPAPYRATVVAGSCVVFQDGAGNQAHIRLYSAAGTECIPDLGTRCVNQF